MKKPDEQFRLTPDQFDVDDSGHLMLDTNHLSTVAENTYETFMSAEDGVTIEIKIEL